MKEVNADLYKFMLDNECHLFFKSGVKAWACVQFCNLKDFVNAIGRNYFDEEGMGIRLFDTYVAVDLNEIIEGEGHLLSSYQECFPEDEWKQYKDDILKDEKDYE